MLLQCREKHTRTILVMYETYYIHTSMEQDSQRCGGLRSEGGLRDMTHVTTLLPKRPQFSRSSTNMLHSVKDPSKTDGTETSTTTDFSKSTRSMRCSPYLVLGIVP